MSECLLSEEQKEFLKEVYSVISSGAFHPKSRNLLVTGAGGTGRRVLVECLERALSGGECLFYNKGKCKLFESDSPEFKNWGIIEVSISNIFSTTEAVVFLLKEITLFLIEELEDIKIKDGESEKKIGEFLNENFSEIWKSKGKTKKENVEDIFEKIAREEAGRKILSNLSFLLQVFYRCEASLKYSYLQDLEKKKELNTGVGINVSTPDFAFFKSIGVGTFGGEFKTDFDWKIAFLSSLGVEISYEAFTLSQAVYYLNKVMELLHSVLRERSIGQDNYRDRVLIVILCEKLLVDTVEKLVSALRNVSRKSNRVSVLIVGGLELYDYWKKGIGEGSENHIRSVIDNFRPIPVPSVVAISEFLKKLDKEEKKEDENIYLLSSLFSGGKYTYAKHLLHLFREKVFREEEKKLSNILQHLLFQGKLIKYIPSVLKKEVYSRDATYYFRRLFYYHLFRLFFDKEFSITFEDVREDESMKLLEKIGNISLFSLFTEALQSLKDLVEITPDGIVKFSSFRSETGRSLRKL